jgi:broad specificity phosphatase PhoE
MSDSSTTSIYLVRHGETIWNAEGRCQGRSHSEFTERGRHQIEVLATSLADVRFDAAYTSPLTRAVNTAVRILGARHVEAVSTAELSELSYGSLQGTRFDDWPRELHGAWRNDPWSVSFPDGESLAMVRDRVLPAFRSIVHRHGGQRVLVSAHGHVNRLIVLEELRRPSIDFWRIEQPNGAATVLQISSSNDRDSPAG